MDPRRKKSRQKLKDGLLELLSHKPLDQISVEEISKTAEVSRPTFYSNFGDSQAIVQELIEECFDEKMSVLKNQFPTEVDNDSEALASYFAHLFESMKGREQLLCIALSGRAGELVMDFTKTSLIALIPHHLFNSGDFSDDDPNDVYISSGLFGVLHSVCDGKLKLEASTIGQLVSKMVIGSRETQ